MGANGFLGNPEYGVDLHPIDFVQFAQACSGSGFRCEKPKEVRPALQAALDSGKPSVVEAVVRSF
jgi:pyruvate dehydrogenase (quinone)